MFAALIQVHEASDGHIIARPMAAERTKFSRPNDADLFVMTKAKVSQEAPEW